MSAIRTISHAKRLMSSKNGNPRYRVYFTDGSSAETQSDAAVSYDIANYVRHGGEYEVTFSKAGRIVTMTPKGE